MRVYRTKVFWFSGLANEPTPRWPQDYHEAEELVQQGTGEEALQHAFRQCHVAGRDMEVGDVVGLDDGSLHRCEASGWTELPEKQWVSRIQQSQGRKRG